MWAVCVVGHESGEACLFQLDQSSFGSSKGLECPSSLILGPVHCQLLRLPKLTANAANDDDDAVPYTVLAAFQMRCLVA